MKQTENPPNYRLDLTFGDCADPQAVKYVSENFYPCIADPRSKHGTRSEDRDVKGAQRQTGWREGVDLINSLLKVREPSDTVDLTDMVSELDLSFADSLRKPSLFVDRRCKDLIREFNNYRAPDTGRGDRNIREAAQPHDDHALDALRYGLMHIFKLGVRNHLADIYPIEEFANSTLPDGGYFQTQHLDF
jgi:hypothetical protein